MRSFFISLRSEFYKSRKTLAFWASILLPLIICGLIAFGFYTNADTILKKNGSSELLWYRLTSNSLGIMGMLILPFYVIFMAFSVNNIEHKNDTWKSLFSQPLNKISIYAAKYLYGVFLIAICLFLFAFLSWISGPILEALNSKFNFSGYSPVKILFEAYFKLFLAALGIFSLQFVFSLLWGDFLKPMGIGFVGTIMGIITANVGWKYAYLIPYSHPALSLQLTKGKADAANMELFTKEIWTSLAYAVALFIAGYFILSKRNIK